jgi:hypothetical protein
MKVTDALTQGLKPKMQTVRASGTRLPPSGLRPLVAESAELMWVWRRDAALRMAGSRGPALYEAAGFRKGRRSRGWSRAIRQGRPQHLAMWRSLQQPAANTVSRFIASVKPWKLFWRTLLQNLRLLYMSCENRSYAGHLGLNVIITNNSVALVRERTIPTERPQAKLVPILADRRGRRVVSTADPLRPQSLNLGFLDWNHYSFFQVAPQLYSQGWVDPVPDPLHRTFGSAESRIRTSESVARNPDH